MIKKIFNQFRLLVGFFVIFLLFWFLNSGFVSDPIWLPIQALFFTIIFFIFLINKKLNINYWFMFVGGLYVISAALEILKVPLFPEVVASSGFGVLIMLILFRLLIRGNH